MYFSPQPGDHTIGSGGQKFGRRCYFQNHAHNEEAEGRLRVSLVSRNARFAHEGRLRVTLVSPSGYFAHEGLGTWHLVHIRLLTYFTGVLSWLLAAVPMNE